jgi:two-component system nitrate/nitrite response regulator NarL
MNLPEPILIVDDARSLFAASSACSSASPAPPALMEAPNAEAALAVTAAERPGLGLLDINMPAMSGTETLREIRARDQEVPVIMPTSLTSHQIIQETLAPGAHSFIRKDIPPREISRFVMDLFRPSAFEGDGP